MFGDGSLTFREFMMREPLPLATIHEAFIAEKNGMPLNLSLEIRRDQYEELIEPLLAKTLKCVDDALADARLNAGDIHKVLLVGGATRTPLVHRMLSTRLGRPVHSEIEPDLAVAMGAAVQGGLIAGVDVGPVLVDITPHTLGIEVLGEVRGLPSYHQFSPIIERNTPLPAVRSEVYSTHFDGQTEAEIRVFQGEGEDTRQNRFVGEFRVQGLANVPAPNRILVRFDLDLNGILRVTATEQATGLAKQVVIDNMMERFRKRQRVDAQERLDALFESAAEELVPELSVVRAPEGQTLLDPELRDAIDTARALIARSREAATGAAVEDAEELQALVTDLQRAIERQSIDDIRRIAAEVEDIVFYLQDH